MNEVTSLLHAMREGDTAAFGRVFAWLYPELLRIARSCVRDDARSLTPTALVHETFVRLVQAQRLELHDRSHFFACAARAMRAIVVDHLRRRSALKRDGESVPIDEAFPIAIDPSVDLLQIDKALGCLDEISSRQREVVEMRFFGGFEFEEIAQYLGCSLRTAKREWDRARAFLHAYMAEETATATR
ncbi:ECF-type sigma factor [Tahibacter amnicola]|uniref:ECF-type sigma factor n=1 Tax=Tahibacter amnicola TaxID=2976241 RepID=A0ABY6BL13_9GAMM|nr:ECF-type sigma factor [Tahibacter amnicola]UXI70472.1 ECF-type sigma factor [Tahibacter amnicola]